jgi:hypothetical protein|tara:strand:+ start:21847 stop:22065 length:219 start_codon:yes stop_codon:yes gene_type:complete
MRENLIRIIDRIVSNAWINIVFGMALLLSGLNEALQNMDQEFSVGAHHGMVLLGLARCFKSLSMLLKGLKKK